MPTILSHPALPLAVGLGCGSKVIRKPLLIAGVFASILPDLDVIGFRLGIPYAAEFGHRGFSHSLALAAATAILGAWGFRKWRFPFSTSALFLFLSMASHGALDAFTTGGKGIALLWPFSGHRFFAPVQVIKVSPLSPSRFLSGRGLAVLLSELQWIWLPSLFVFGILLLYRRRWRPHPSFNAADPL